MQIISFIVAMSKNHVIGCDGKLPWEMPADLAYFKKMTVGKTVVMGRKTFDSIGRPLPNRRNIVVTRNRNTTLVGCEVVHSIEAILDKTKDEEQEIMVIGGELIYREMMDVADRIYLTIIDTVVEGDAVFPKWNESEWVEIERIEHQADSDNPHDYCFLTLERKKQ